MENKVNIIALIQSQVDKPLSILFIIPLLFLFILSRSGRRNRYPPGPKGWPVIGNITMMHHLTHRGLAALAKRYGGVVHLRMGRLHVFAVSSPEAAREVLQLHDHIFSNRPANIAISYLTYDRADMAFANYGPFWRQMRKLCVMKLFSRKRAESWDSVRDEVDVMVRTVAAASGGAAAVNVGELVFGLTRNIVYRAAFGTSSPEGQDEFIAILQEFSKLFGAFNVADFVPWLDCMDLQGINSRLRRARDSLDGFIDSIIDEHIQKKKRNGLIECGDMDMVDELLGFYSEEEAKISVSEDLQSSIHLTRNNIKAIIMVESLTAKITFFEEFLEAYNPLLGYSTEADPLEARIADAAYEAEDVIESNIVDSITNVWPESICSDGVYRGLEKVIQDMASIQKEATDIRETMGLQLHHHTNSTPQESLRSISTAHNSRSMVGVDDVLHQIKDELTSNDRRLKIIPIVGMGESGKTTLASNIYQDPLIHDHFDVYAWGYHLSRIHYSRNFLTNPS